MRRHSVILCFAIAGALSPARSADSEIRALYVTRWHMTSDSEVSDAVAYAAAHSFNMLFCQVFGDAAALYDSAVAPRSHLVSPGFDALAAAVERGHAEGLEVHAYINTVNVWSGGLGFPGEPEHIVNAHPEWSMEDFDGVRDVDLADVPDAFVFFCPREPEFVEYLADVAAEIASSYEIDGIHIDYTRYPSERHCFCERHRTAFRALFDRDPEPGDTDFDRFREDDVFDLVASMREAIAAARPTAVLSATFISPSRRKGQDAQRWLEEGVVDIGVPMLYTDDLTAFEDSLRWFHERSGGRHIAPSINVGVGPAGAELDIARSVGAEGVAIFTSNIVTPDITAEIDARFSDPAPPPLYPWLDGSEDEVPPVVSAVRVLGVGSNEATVLWHTDERATSAVDYGTTPARGMTAEVGSPVFEHVITLGGLLPDTTYHFRVRSSDAAANETPSGDATFRTTAGEDLEVILDDGDADVVFSGTWLVGTSAGGHGDDYRWTTDQPAVTATAAYRPFLPHAGDWEVAVTYVPGGNRVTSAPYTVAYEGGSEDFSVDQTSLEEPWIVLGTFGFESGWGAEVLLTNLATGGDVVVADAVRWRYAGGPANPPFRRGDANGDDDTNVADAISILSYLFGGVPLAVCGDAMDVGDDGKVDISDAIYLLGFLFAGGDPPRPPFPGAGHDPTPDDPFTCGD